MQCTQLSTNFLYSIIKKNLVIIAIFFLFFCKNLNSFDDMGCQHDMTSSYYESNEIFSGMIERIVKISPIDQIADIKVYEFFKSNHEIRKHHRYVLINNENVQNFTNGQEYLFYATRIGSDLLYIPRCTRTDFLSNSTPDIMTFYAKFLPRPHKKNSGVGVPGYQEYSFMKAFKQIKTSIYNFFHDLLKTIVRLLR